MQMTLRQMLARMRKLHELDAPPTIKAHYLMNCILPKLMAEIGIAACSEELARVMFRGIAVKASVCTICGKAPSVPTENLCAACVKELDEFDQQFP